MPSSKYKVAFYERHIVPSHFVSIYACRLTTDTVVIDFEDGLLLMALRFYALDQEADSLLVKLKAVYNSYPDKSSNTVRGITKMADLGLRCSKNVQVSAGNLTRYKVIKQETLVLAEWCVKVVMGRVRRDMVGVYNRLRQSNLMPSTWLVEDAPVHR